MGRRAAQSSRSTGFFVTAGFCLVALVLLTELPVAAGPRGYIKGAASPLAALTSAAIDRVSSAAGLFGDAARLRDENQRLREENAALTRQLIEARAAGADDVQLRQAVGFERSFGHRLLAAAVIGRSPDGLDFALTIDRGRADGVQVGMVVASGAGLVGRVFEAGQHSASVRTLSDSQSRVNAYTSTSLLEGTVIGVGGPLSMDVIPRAGTAVAPGEWALTSGIGGTFPRGLLVGQVTQFHRRDSATTESADVAPAVDFARVTTVLVILDFTPAA